MSRQSVINYLHLSLKILGKEERVPWFVPVFHIPILFMAKTKQCCMLEYFKHILWHVLTKIWVVAVTIGFPLKAQVFDASFYLCYCGYQQKVAVLLSSQDLQPHWNGNESCHLTWYYMLICSQCDTCQWLLHVLWRMEGNERKSLETSLELDDMSMPSSHLTDASRTVYW